MNTYEKRLSENPDVYETILYENIQYQDFIKTTYGGGGRYAAEAWSRGAPAPEDPAMNVYTRDKFLLAMPTPVQVEMQMIMDGAIQIGADATAIATNRATLKVVDRSFSSNPIIESANAETQAMYDVLEAIVPSFDAAVRTLLETGEAI